MEASIETLLWMEKIGGAIGIFCTFRESPSSCFTELRVRTGNPRDAALQFEKLRDPRFEVTVVNRENPILDRVPCEKERGRVRVNSNLEVEGVDGLWAWVIARSFQIQRQANIVRRRRNTHRAKAKLSPATSSRAFTERRKRHLALKPSARLLRSVAAPVSREFSARTFPDSSLGFSGAGFTGANCHGRKRKCASRSIGRWTFFSRKISSNFSINVRLRTRRLRPARRCGIASILCSRRR